MVPKSTGRLHGTVKLKSSTWHMDETYVWVAGRWMYLFRAVDAHGQTVDFYLSETRDREAKLFLKKALANEDNRAPHVFARDGLRSYPAAEGTSGRGLVERRCHHRVRRCCNNRIEGDHRHVKRRLHACRVLAWSTTAWVAIQGIEAAYMTSKGQVLGVTRRNLHG